MKESTRRISELVAAVRSYSQMDRASLQQIDVTDGLESTLVMLGHKLRDGVTVVRDYGADVPRIEAYAGELNQVWTNLIDNAVDAMDGAGTLRVATRADGDGVVVEIADTGPGMPPEVAGARLRGVLHDQGRRQGHRPRPRHRPPHRRRAARRHDHHRLPTGRDRAAGPPPDPAGRGARTATVTAATTRTTAAVRMALPIPSTKDCWAAATSRFPASPSWPRAVDWVKAIELWAPSATAGPAAP